MRRIAHMARALSASGGLLLAHCADPKANPPDELVVEIGIPDVTRRNFEPLDEANTVYYSKGAQVQEFIMLAVRARGPADEAFVDVTVTSDATGDEVSRSAGSSPEPLSCEGEDGWCTLAPLLLPASTLGDPSALNDVPISVKAAVRLENGAQGEASVRAKLKFR